MKNLEEIKNEVAVKFGYVNWMKCVDSPSFKYSFYIDEVMQEYAKQCCDEQKKIIAEKILIECKSKLLGDELYKQISNTPNVVTTKP